MAKLRIKLIIGFFALCSAIFSPLLAAKTLTEVQRQLAAQSIVRGKFEQIRQMELFKQPLTSSGIFTIVKDKGLIWQQTKPFAVTLVLTKNKLSQKFSGQQEQVMTAEQNPMAFYFSHLFLDLFQGGVSSLDEQFSQNFTSEQDSWALKLIPNTAPLNKVFSSIEIAGQDYIDSVKLTEIRGDITTIIFSQQTTKPSELSNDKQAVF